MADQDGRGGTAGAAEIEASLRGLGTPQRAVSEKAYLKSDLEFTGTPVPAIRATVRAWCRGRQNLARAELIAVTEALWARPVHECRMAAVELLDANPGLPKAIGWILRDTAKRRPELVAEWLEPRAHRASGVTMREAVKPLAPEVAARLLAARAGQRGGSQAR